jgi:type IV conjugative transfer system protein TraE
MIFSTHLSKTLRTMAANRLLTFVCIVMAGCSIMNHYSLKQALTYQRTILLPMKVTEKMSFQGNDADDSYFRDTAHHIASLAFTYSPATARGNFNDVLTTYDPELYAKGKKELSALLQKVEVARVCSVFYPHSFKISRATNSIEMSGLRRLIAEDGSMPENMQKTYVLKYRLADGKFMLQGIEEKAATSDTPVEQFKQLQ